MNCPLVKVQEPQNPQVIHRSWHSYKDVLEVFLMVKNLQLYAMAF
jgi:hypothetical protein